MYQVKRDKHTLAEVAPFVIPNDVIDVDREKELITDYILIDPDLWDDIPWRNHIRYRSLDGHLHLGGMVLKSNEVRGDPMNPKNAIIGFLLVNKFAKYGEPRNSTFIPHSQIKQVYLKNTAELSMMRRKIRELTIQINENFKELRSITEDLRNKINEISKR